MWGGNHWRSICGTFRLYFFMAVTSNKAIKCLSHWRFRCLSWKRFQTMRFCHKIWFYSFFLHFRRCRRRRRIRLLTNGRIRKVVDKRNEQNWLLRHYNNLWYLFRDKHQNLMRLRLTMAGVCDASLPECLSCFLFNFISPFIIWLCF